MSKTNKLSKEQVLHIAKLAKLKLNSAEVAKFQKQLGEILSYMDILNELNTSEVKPTAQATGLENVLRKDKEGVYLTQEEALANTKSKHNGYFKVKAIFPSGILGRSNE